MKCCLCDHEIDVERNELGDIVWDQGHNAEPLAEGRCCSTCNWRKVIPARIGRLVKRSTSNGTI